MASAPKPRTLHRSGALKWINWSVSGIVGAQANESKDNNHMAYNLLTQCPAFTHPAEYPRQRAVSRQ